MTWRAPTGCTSGCSRTVGAFLGPTHLDTLSAMNDMAEMLGEVGNLDGARDLHREVLGARRRVLGDRPPQHLALDEQPGRQPYVPSVTWPAPANCLSRSWPPAGGCLATSTLTP